MGVQVANVRFWVNLVVTSIKDELGFQNSGLRYGNAIFMFFKDECNLDFFNKYLSIMGPQSTLSQTVQSLMILQGLKICFVFS